MRQPTGPCPTRLKPHLGETRSRPPPTRSVGRPPPDRAACCSPANHPPGEPVRNTPANFFSLKRKKALKTLVAVADNKGWKRSFDNRAGGKESVGPSGRESRMGRQTGGSYPRADLSIGQPLDVTPKALLLRPICLLIPHAAVLPWHHPVLDRRSSVLDCRSSALDCRSSALGCRSSVLGCRSSVLGRRPRTVGRRSRAGWAGANGRFEGETPAGPSVGNLQ